MPTHEVKWFVYLLICSDEQGSLYCGITNDLEKRIGVHNSGRGAKYTKTRLPVKLYWFEESKDRSSASKREYQIKRLSRAKTLALKNPSN
jgi:putative endonuclease